MRQLLIIALLNITMSFSVSAEPYEFDNDANFSQLEECKDFFMKEKDVKTIKLLNGKKIELKGDSIIENNYEDLIEVSLTFDLYLGNNPSVLW